MFSQEESRVKKHLPTKKVFPQDISQYKEKVKLSSGSLIRKKLREEAKSEILKQECKVDALDTCIREFQRQAHSNRLEMDSVHCGYAESQREQARLHEESVQREKALRETRIRTIHGMEELKKAQEMRFNEFSVQIERKVMLRYRSLLHRYRNCKKGCVHGVARHTTGTGPRTSESGQWTSTEKSVS